MNKNISKLIEQFKNLTKEEQEILMSALQRYIGNTKCK